MSANVLAPETPRLDGVACPVVEGSGRIQESYEQYLWDESRLAGEVPDRIWFPRTTLEAAAAIRDIARRGERATVSGSRTGIVGGAVNMLAQNILSLERLVFRPRLNRDEKTGTWSVIVGAGMKLEDLAKAIKKKDYDAKRKTPSDLFYPVDPTELSASIGGTVAANASGARTLYYGPTRDWVLTLTVVLVDGRVLRLRRGEVAADDGMFRLRMPDGTSSPIDVPAVRMPGTKHVAGYYLKPDMDAVDLFIGGEGTLGVVTEIELKLATLPPECLYLCVFLPARDRVVEVVREVKRRLAPVLLAIEYMDKRSIDILLDYKRRYRLASGVPPIPHGTEGVLYFEIGFEGDSRFEAVYDALAAAFQEYDISMESTWAGFTHRDMEDMKKFRHALPERINAIIAERKSILPEITKVGTDMAVPDEALADIMAEYYESIEQRGLQFAVFGHIGNGHLHVNILPRSATELETAKSLYLQLARKAVALGGSVAAEHGIGRLKKDFMRIQYSDEEIRAMMRIKDQFDPRRVLNPGVLFNFPE